MKRLLLFFLSFFLIEVPFGQFYQPFFQNSLPVLLVVTKNNDTISLGSGFIFRDSTSLYLVTARHVLMKPHVLIDSILKKKTTYYQLSNQTVDVYYSSCGNEENERNKWVINLQCLFDHKSLVFDTIHDVMVFKIGSFKSGKSQDLIFPKCVRPDKPCYSDFLYLDTRWRKYDLVNPSMDVFLIGFPESLRLKNSQQFDYNKPLFRKGIVGGKNDKNRTIIIDCPVYPGNSGCPVIIWFNYIWEVIGIVTDYIPYKENIYNLDEKRNTGIIWSNSGYSVVVPIDYVLDLVEKLKK